MSVRIATERGTTFIVRGAWVKIVRHGQPDVTIALSDLEEFVTEWIAENKPVEAKDE